MSNAGLKSPVETFGQRESGTPHTGGGFELSHRREAEGGVCQDILDETARYKYVKCERPWADWQWREFHNDLSLGCMGQVTEE